MIQIMWGIGLGVLYNMYRTARAPTGGNKSSYQFGEIDISSCISQVHP